jgi:hypothetical protein
MCALWFHQTVKGRLPKYGKYRNITPYLAPQSRPTRKYQLGESTPKRTQPSLYIIPHAIRPAQRARKVLGLVSILPGGEDTFAPST